VFVGNVPLDSSIKQIKTLFKECGEIEKAWFRSIAVDHESVIPLKAKIIKN
jgi:RNA recognition motif-containing protein